MTNPDQEAKIHVVGIDVSKRILDVCILPSEAGSTAQGESFVLAND